MADGDLLTLLLKIEGGTASAAEIHQVESALKNVSAESDNLKVRFQEGFQHVALRGFIADAARSAGIGTELRPILSLVNLGVNELETSFGVLGSSMGLVLTGLTALAGIALVAYNHFHKHAEAVDEVTQKNNEAIKTNEELIASINKYANAIGGLPPELKSVAESTDKLSYAERQLFAIELSQKLIDLQEQADKAGAKFQNLASAYAFAGADLNKFGIETNGTKELTLKQSEALSKLNVEFLKLTAQIDQAKEAQERFQKTGDVQPLKDSTDEKLKQKEKEYQALEAEAKRAMEENNRANEDEFEREKKRSEELLAIRKKHLQEYESEVKKVTSAVAGEFGRATAKMIVEGKSLSDTLSGLGTQVAETIIADLVKIAAQAAITEAALMLFGGPAAGAAGGPVQALGHVLE